MKHYYCTYFDRNYLVKGLTMINSLNLHETNDFELFVVCCDEITRLVLNKLNLSHVTLVPFHQFEQGDIDLLEAKHNRAEFEYYWTTTPTVMLRLLEWYPQVDVITYLDADLYFFSSPEPIFAEYGDHDVAIYDHRFSPDLKQMAIFGKYNVGSMCFRNNPNGLKVLKWWRDRCNEWCYCRVENGKYGDQAYLDDWPTRFAGVRVIENIGAGAGPWNQANYQWGLDDSKHIILDNQPLIFYHFHSLTFKTPDMIVVDRNHNYPFTEEIIRLCYTPYLDALRESVQAVQSIMPEFMFGLVTPVDIRPEDISFTRKDIKTQIGIQDVKLINLNERWNGYFPYKIRGIKPRVAEETLGVSSATTPTQSGVLAPGSIRPSDESEFYLEQAQKFIDKEDSKSAGEILDLGLKLFPDQIDLLMMRGDIHLKQKDYQAAAEKYSRVLELKLEYTPALAGKAEALFNLGKKGEAEQAAREALDLDPECEQAHETLAHILGYTSLDELINKVQKLVKYGMQKLDEFEGQKALSKLRQALKLTESHPALTSLSGQVNSAMSRVSAIIGVDKANMYIAQSKWGPAEKALAEGANMFPEEPQVMVAHAAVLVQQEKLEEARQVYVKATVLAPEYSPAFVGLATLLIRMDRKEEAEKALLRAAELDPGDKQIMELYAKLSGQPNWSGLIAEAQKLIYEGETLLSTGEQERAIEKFNQVIDLTANLPPMEKARANLQQAVARITTETAIDQANEMLQQGNTQAAGDLLTQSLDKNPDDSQLLLAHGNVLEILGDYETARRQFVKATTFDPQNAAAYAALAEVLLRLDRKTESANAANKALEIDPANTQAHNILASLSGSADFNALVEKVQKLIQEGQAKFQQGDHAAALEFFNEANRHIGEHPALAETRQQLNQVIDQITAALDDH